MHNFSHSKLFSFIFLFGTILLLYPVDNALAQKKISWERLDKTAPPGLQQQVQKDYIADTNLDRPAKVGEMQLLQVQQPQAKPLYLINTRIPSQSPDANPTCGQAGCLFYGYTKSGNKFIQVLNGYINDFRLRNAPPVIQPTNQIANQLPCLQLNSYKKHSQQLIRTKLCFDGKEYQPN